MGGTYEKGKTLGSCGQLSRAMCAQAGKFITRNTDEARPNPNRLNLSTLDHSSNGVLRER
jgi:hypothetical protein